MRGSLYMRATHSPSALGLINSMKLTQFFHGLILKNSKILILAILKNCIAKDDMFFHVLFYKMFQIFRGIPSAIALGIIYFLI